jgi:hypothetical protein
MKSGGGDMLKRWVLSSSVAAVLAGGALVPFFGAAGASAEELPSIASSSHPVFHHAGSYTGDCSHRPPGMVCIGYSDGYVLLIHDSIIGWVSASVPMPAQIAYGAHGQYWHILGTDLVSEVIYP